MLAKLIALGLGALMFIIVFYIVQDFANSAQAFAHEAIASPMRQIYNSTSH